MLTDALRYEEEERWAELSHSTQARRARVSKVLMLFIASSRSSPIRRQMIERQSLALQWSSTLRVGSVPTETSGKSPSTLVDFTLALNERGQGLSNRLVLNCVPQRA